MCRVILFPVLSVFFVITPGLGQYFETESRSCRNPNGRLGACVSFQDCQTLYSLLQRVPIKRDDSEFIRASECFDGYGTGPYYVCCTGDTGFWHHAFEWPVQDLRAAGKLGIGLNIIDSEESGKQKRDMPARRQMSVVSEVNLPRPPMCGGVTISNKIYMGMDADLYEFPWMALLEYRRAFDTSSTSCSGSLINNRYVLTAAHCLRTTLIAVRLGEYDTTKVVDCLGSLCAPAAFRVGIEERIPHELFNKNSANQKHDIALLRLSQHVSFSVSIRPICLPSAVQEEAVPPVSGTLYTVAGWGATLSSPRSAIKQKVQVPLVDLWQCQQKFRERSVKVVDSQICAGGNFAEDSCTGDSGSPLMRFRNSAWVLEGIVSFGYKCGLEGWPAVHTRVAYYDDWIRSKVRL